MNYLKDKEQVLAERLGSINEQVIITADEYKVKTVINIPKSLINGFVSKAKKENGVDARQNWSDTDLAEMFTKYIIDNFVNIESLPVNAILGEPAKTQGQAQGDVQPAEAVQNLEIQPNQAQTPQPQVQTQPAQGDVQAPAQPQPTGEIQ